MASFLAHPFPIAVALSVLALVLADWRLDRARRAAPSRMAGMPRPAPGRIAHGAAVARSAGAMHAWLVRRLGRHPLTLRFTGWALLASCALAVLILGPALMVLAPRPADQLRAAIPHFAAPAAVAGWCSLAFSMAVIAAMARRRRLAWQAPAAVLQIAVAGFLWLAAMHGGVWLEWRQKVSPLGFGGEYFYAQMYLTYMREPAGRLISITILALCGLPAVAAIFPFVWSLVAVTAARAALAVAHRGLSALARARRGIPTAVALAAGLVALYLRWLSVQG